MGLGVAESMSQCSCPFWGAPTLRSGFSSILSAFRVNTASSEHGVAAEPALQRAPCGMSGGRPAVSYRTMVPLDTLCDTYGLADDAIDDPAGTAESGAPA